MTAKTIEEQILDHTKSIATLIQGLENTNKWQSESRKSNGDLFRKLEESAEKLKIDFGQFSLRLALAEKEIADLKLLIERGRSNRWALFLSLLGIILSFIGSAVIALYVKPK